MESIIRRIIRRATLLFPKEIDKELKRFLSEDCDDKLRYEYDLNKSSLVLDLGGFKGQWASDIYSRYNCRILIFEPVKLFACKINERFKNNQNIEVFNLALGATSRIETISLNADGSSVHINTNTKESIQFEDVETFFVSNEIKHIDLMKVNIEGGEYELLTRLVETGIINNIDNLQIQFHDIGIDATTHMDMICNDLAKTHKPTYKYKFVWENWLRKGI